MFGHRLCTPGGANIGSVITPFVAVVAALAVARVTRLITDDYLIAPIRQALIKRWGVKSKLSYLLTCPWCMSVWVGAAVAAGAWKWGDSGWFIVPAVALAASHVTGVLATREGE